MRPDSPVVHLMRGYQDRETFCGRKAEQWISASPVSTGSGLDICVKCAKVAALMIMGDK